ncbi:MAG: dockerin type I repeat-containing protein [Clostridiales bacterium]|nr:dockerin type I repeat-containing protein [Clostridiales bacterium]
MKGTIHSAAPQAARAVAGGKAATGRRLACLAIAAALLLAAFPAGVFAAGNVVSVSTGAELDAALTNAPTGSTIVLLADIDAVSSATYPGKTLTIDGGGFTVDGKGIEKSTIRFAGTSDITLKNIAIKNCVGNIRYGGGGFAIFRGTLAVSNASFINNTSLQGDGGGVLIDGGGGSIVNSTFYGNSTAANGGAFAAAGDVTLVNNTIVGNTAGTNGGGIFNNSRTATHSNVAYNNIIVGNTAVAGADAYRFKDAGNNLLGLVGSAEANPLDPPEASSIYGIGASDAAAWLAQAPASNGSSLPTIALLDAAGSPAVDKANALVAPSADQRGVARDGAPDIGSYELLKASSSVVNGGRLTADAAQITNPTDVSFTLSAKLAALDRINTIEAVFDFDAANFTASAQVLSSAYDVASASVNQETGKISLLIGVVKEQVISYDEITALARATLTVKDGQKPAEARLALSKFAIYSEGSSVNATVIAGEAGTGLAYPGALPLDVNNDGAVDAGDLSLALYYFGAVQTDATWAAQSAADVNYDGRVDMVDIMMIVSAIHAAV